MKRYLLALEYKDNKPLNLVLGEFPWSGIQKVAVKDSLELNDTIENLGITKNFDLVGYSGELNRYTSVNAETQEVIKKSLVAIAKSENYQGKIYLLTDGLSEPSWKSIPELTSFIQKHGYRLANAKIVVSEDGSEILQPIKGELDFIDFKEYQLEYRKYLKSQKG